ncbi:MAG TPA: glycoside hydrolase [Rubrobacteraceae bacterium]|nr:glycoside hydrolase [Rubrobacteraceae bacterium]
MRENDMGGWTRASQDLYPHQWSWDTGFIAIGLAHLDVARAARELLGLFDHQWKTGKVPHIVFNPDAPPGSYFPGAEHWSSAGKFPDAPPSPPYTSALCQPPIHAIAAWRIWEVAVRAGQEAIAIQFLREIYPRLLRWHRYLLTYRDPEGSGLVTIYHPWESGTDNSPRWDGAMQNLEVGEVPDYERRDLQHVEDPEARPTGFEYDRYIWLVELIKRARCDERVLYATHPFLVKDVLASAILIAANEALLDISGLVDAAESDRAEMIGWIDRGRRSLDSCWDGEIGLTLDFDLREGSPLRSRTVAGFSALLDRHVAPERIDRQVETLFSERFAGNPRLRWPLPPSASPGEEGFQPRSYWRGPTWPMIHWLLWWTLTRIGETRAAANLRQAALTQLAEEGFAEYFEPFTGVPLGSLRQSWTAAVALDWLADDST